MTTEQIVRRLREKCDSKEWVYLGAYPNAKSHCVYCITADTIESLSAALDEPHD